MSRELIFDLSMLIAVVGIFFGVLMMIGTAIYLNRSTKRFRIFELGYSKDSDWYRKGKVDFFTANYVINHTAIAGLKLRSAKENSKLKLFGSPLAPNLHIDGNYDKLFEEFPFFVKWELFKLLIIIFSLLFAIFGIGLNKGWW